MQLSLTFSTLLAGVLLALDVSAVPVAQPPRMVTLPLKRMEVRSDAHPQIVRCISIMISHSNQTNILFFSAAAAASQPCQQASCAHDWTGCAHQLDDD
jgi:hypothetical protein